YGLAGGEPGAPGENRLRLAGGAEERLPGKFRRTLPAGARLTIATPGGGGWGQAHDAANANGEARSTPRGPRNARRSRRSPGATASGADAH
ncbi:MAG: hydantoinase B/oxoprolinase family protein, partial [Ktedonobacterales bacterium]